MNLWWACTVHVINLHEATKKIAYTADGTDHQVLITMDICSAKMEVCQWRLKIKTITGYLLSCFNVALIESHLPNDLHLTNYH